MMSVRLINLSITLLLFFIFIITSFKSSDITIKFFDSLRLVLAFITSFLIIISLFKTSNNKKLLFEISLLLFLIVYGILLNFINIKNVHLLVDIPAVIQLYFAFIFSFFLLKIVKYFKDLDNYNHIIFYSFLIMTFIFFFLDGFNFKELKFNFEGQTYYSLGLTSTFFLAFFTSFYLFNETNYRINPAKTIFYLLISLFFLFFGLSAGGRGEVIFGSLVFFMFAGYRKSFLKFVVFFLLAVLLIIINFDHLIFFERLPLFLNDDYGSRPELIVLSLNLLYNEPKCLLFGCGFNFFQDYYGLEPTLYPHNIILEFVVTYGLLISIFIFTFVFICFKKYLFQKLKICLIDIFIIYLFLNSLKSGALISLMAFPIIFYFISRSNLNFDRKFKFKKY
jgi:hypothetical protein